MIILIIVIVLIFFYLLLGIYFFNFSLNPKFSKKKLFKGKKNNIFFQDEISRKWYQKISKKDTFITSFDNLKLHAYEINNNNKLNWVIIIHGYTNEGKELLKPAQHFFKRGYNVLLIDQRAHGKSEGKFSTMGYYESKDLIRWIEYLKLKNNKVNIVLYGISMGATTIMLSTCQVLSPNVKCAIEDSGFISIYDQFYNQLKYLKFPPKIVIFSAFIIEKIVINFNIYKTKVKKNFPNKYLPMLFIHGEKDKFVSFKLFNKAYDMYNCHKEKLIVPNAKHMASLKENEPLYWNTIDEFIKNKTKEG